MTQANAVKKLSGFAAVQSDGGFFWATKDGHTVRFTINGQGPHVTCFHTQRASDQADSQTDYFPGSYWPNLTQAIKAAERAIAGDREHHVGSFKA